MTIRTPFIRVSAISVVVVLTVVATACAQTDKVTSMTVHYFSRALNAETTYVAILPARLEAKRYPVLYLLHGAFGGYMDWPKNTPVEKYHAGRDMIIITPDGSPFGWYLDSPVKKRSQYDTAISHDLVADVDARFPTVADRAGRGIAGLSMGGHGALSLAAKHPDVFGSASSMSGILNITNHPGSWHLDDVLGKQPEAVEIWKQHSVLGLAPRFSEARVKLMFDTGTEDKTGAVKDNREVDDRLTSLSIAHTYKEYPGAHTWKYWSEHVPSHIEFHEKCFSEAGHARKD